MDIDECLSALGVDRLTIAERSPPSSLDEAQHLRMRDLALIVYEIHGVHELVADAVRVVEKLDRPVDLGSDGSVTQMEQ